MDATFPNIDKAKRKALEVLEANLITEPPIIAEKLVKPYGLDVRFSVFKPEYRNIAGFIDSEHKLIVVNAEDSLQQRNFTTAHELGHHLLKHNLQSEEYAFLSRNHADQKNTCIEQEANCFATNLLVPTFLLKQYLTEYPFAKDEQLAIIFGVPIEIMRYRRDYSSL